MNTVQDALDWACQRSAEGRRVEAEEMYRQILAQYPGYYDALHGLGAVLAASGRMAEAAAAFRGAVQSNPLAAEAKQNLGVVLFATGDFGAAREAFQACLEVEPDRLGAHRMLGWSLIRLGRKQEGVEAFRDALKRHPDDPVLLNDFGVALTDHVPAASPEAALAQWREAETRCRRAVELKPDFAEAHNNLGNALSKLGRWSEAVASYERTVALNSGFPATYMNLGSALFYLRRYQEAVECFRKAQALSPLTSKAHANMGCALLKLGAYDESIRELELAISLDSGYWDDSSHLALAYAAKGDYARARQLHERAVALAPTVNTAHWNYSLLLLLVGDFAAGWREYEWRFGCGVGRKSYSKSRWNGEAIPGKTLVIHAEQGFGDSIQFARYLPMACERAAAGRVLFVCQTKLERLFRRATGWGVEIIASDADDDSEVPEYDCYAPLLSLPMVLGIAAPVEASAAYLTGESALREAWRERLGSTSALRVGIAWQGNPDHKEDARRSVPTHAIKELLGVYGVEFYSLQLGLPEAVRSELDAAGVRDFTAELRDFEDTAALVAELDLVISVDTAVAHLGSALGKPVFALIYEPPDWRWGLQTETTPWYASMRLFRQDPAGEWTGVILQVRREIERLAAERET